MRTAFDRWAAPALLGTGGLLAAVSTLFSSGSSNGRLVWIGLAALVVATVVAAWAFLGLPRPALAREAVAALLFLTAFAAWNGITVLWSIEPDRSWDYLNRGLVYLAFAIVGVAVGSIVPRATRAWAYVLAAALALPLGWALLTKAVPAVSSASGRIARLSSPVGYWNALGLLFAMALPLALWLAARREHAHWLRMFGVVYVYALVVGLLLTYSRGGVLAASSAEVPGSPSRCGRSRALGSPRMPSRIRSGCTTANGSRPSSCSPPCWSVRSGTSARSSRSGGRSTSAVASFSARQRWRCWCSACPREPSGWRSRPSPRAGSRSSPPSRPT
jgi:hypothetical protein